MSVSSNSDASDGEFPGTIAIDKTTFTSVLPPATKQVAAAAPVSVPKGPAAPAMQSKPLGPIVARMEAPLLGWIELDEELRDEVLRGGGEVEALDGTKLRAIPQAQQPQQPARRIHRKKVVTSESTTVAASQAPTISSAPTERKRPLSSLPMCQQCVRAMALIERIKASNDGYRNTCEYLIEQHPVGSQARIQARTMVDATATIAQFAVGDAQYVLRNLACARGCLVVPGTTVQQHTIEPTAPT